MTTATTRSVVIEKELPHALEKVWRALTQGALIKEWLLDNDFQLVAGHRFRFRAKPVRMEHSGFRLDQEAAYKGAKYGWQNFIKGLERVVSELQ
jgi:uncharacterized protein YndB with AHSA1/START domain